MKEPVLSLNAFNMPKVFDEVGSTYLLIIRLILLEPGTFQSHPNMGVGIKSRYRYNNDDNFMINLKNDISSQISTYLPELQYTDITLTNKNNRLGLIITTNDGSYVLAYDNESNSVDPGASYVLNDL